MAGELVVGPWYRPTRTMARPHPSLIDIAAARPVAPVDDPSHFVVSAAEHRMAGLASWVATQQDYGLDQTAKHDSGRLQGFDVPCAGVWVDMHTDPVKVGVALPRPDELWARTERRTVRGIPCRVLDVETSILQAVLHLQEDRFSELIGFADVARMADDAVDWGWLESYAAAAGLSVHLNEGLRVISEVLDIELPYDRTVSSRIWRRLWPETSRLRGGVGLTRKVRNPLLDPVHDGGSAP